MAFDTSWDVNKYKYHYELPHHWELKKKFMMFHKDKYPEDRLVCLAQIFCNVHELGCRYGEEIMELIDDLTKGLTDRNEKFDSKSFSLASNAVEERVKAFTGQSKQSNFNTVRRTTEPISFVRSEEPERRQWESTSREVVDLTHSPNERKRPGDNFNNGNFNKMPRYYQDQQPNPGSQQSGQYQVAGQYPYQESRPEKTRAEQLYSWESKRAAASVKDVIESGPFGKVVVFRSSAHNEGAINIVERAASAAHMRSSYDYTTSGENVNCKFCLDGFYVSHGVGRSQKLAKEAACQLALERLKETSFTIEVKASYVAGETTVGRDMEGGAGQGRSGVEIPLAESNIGSKMLKMMGWTGGGLGKDEQGIEEPIKPYDQNIKRGGLGITNFYDFRKKVTRILEDFAHSDDKNDLVFSPDFSKDERKTIHDLVRKYNLKSRSYGKNEDIRHIVVFKKIQPLEIVQELLACGGETQKYKLISPNPKTK